MISGALPQNPTPSPARYPAPSAVVSFTADRATGTPSTSAWNCISSRFSVAPPSTRSHDTGAPVSSAIAPSMSRVWYAIDSSAARATCPAVVPRVSPTMAPRAYMSQYGAPRPENAGTRYTPPLSATSDASRSDSAELSMIPQTVPQPLHRRPR